MNQYERIHRNQGELEALISVMTRSEKRTVSIKLGKSKLKNLFNAISSGRTFRDKQVHNLRSQLYRELLQILEPVSVEKSLYEGLDQVNMLLERDLYGQAYKVLVRIKQTAGYYQQVTFSLKLALLECRIRAHYAPLADPGKLKNLEAEYRTLSAELAAISEAYLRMIRLEQQYLKYGVSIDGDEMIGEGALDAPTRHDEIAESPHKPLTQKNTGFYLAFYEAQISVYTRLLNGIYTDAKELDQLLDDYPQMKTVESAQYNRIKRIALPELVGTEDRFSDDPCTIANYYFTAKHYHSKLDYSKALDYLIPFLHTRISYRQDLGRAAKALLIDCHERLGNSKVVKGMKRGMKN